MSNGRMAAAQKPIYRAKSIDLFDTTPNPTGPTVPEHYKARVLADTIRRYGANNDIAMMLGLIPSPVREVIVKPELPTAICDLCGWETAAHRATASLIARHKQTRHQEVTA